MSPAEEAAPAARAVRSRSARRAGQLSRRSTAAEIGRVAIGDPDGGVRRRRPRRSIEWRTVPAPRRGELVRLLGEELRAAKEPLAAAGDAGSRQDRPGRPRRSPGDDRHLRLRGRPVAPALWPDHRQRAARPPDDGAMASARAGAGDQRLQFPGRGVGVERGAGAGLRRPGDLEAERKDPADRRRGDGAGRAGARAVRRCAGRACCNWSRAGARSARLWSTTRALRWFRRPARPRWAAPSARASRSGSAASLLELGGNNAMIVAPSADLELAARAILFSAAGTAGQRCTTLRRLIVHDSIADALVERLQRAVRRRQDRRSARSRHADRPADRRGGASMAMRAVLGDDVERGRSGRGRLLRAARRSSKSMRRRARCSRRPSRRSSMCFATASFDEAIALNNAVPQGLSSSIFTNDLREAERFLSAAGSDCGIANVNIGPSGAEIGGAFGGEKETGGGRESGSDSWRAYMRRQTNTINYGTRSAASAGHPLRRRAIGRGSARRSASRQRSLNSSRHGASCVRLERRRDEIALDDVAAELAQQPQLLDASRRLPRWRSGRGRGRGR